MSDEKKQSDRQGDTGQSDAAASDFDPRPVSDAELREEVSREQAQDYQRQADQAHRNWFSVMNNPYGKD